MLQLRNVRLHFPKKMNVKPTCDFSSTNCQEREKAASANGKQPYFQAFITKPDLLLGERKRTIEASETCCIGVSDIDCKLTVVQIIV